MQPLDDGELLLGRAGAGDRIPARFLNADSSKALPTLLVHADGRAAAERSEIGRALIGRGGPVLMIDTFQTGSAIADRDIAGAGRNSERYYHVFNRSDDANRVQDILTAAAFLRGNQRTGGIRLIGTGRAGLWTLLAAALDGGLQSVVADIDGFDAATDAEYVEGLFIPGLRRAGDFRAVASLVSDRNLLLHNASDGFPIAWYRAAFDAAGRPESLKIEEEVASADVILEWLAH